MNSSEIFLSVSECHLPFLKKCSSRFHETKPKNVPSATLPSSDRIHAHLTVLTYMFYFTKEQKATLNKPYKKEYLISLSNSYKKYVG